MARCPYKKRKDGRYYKQFIIGYTSEGKRIVKTLYDKNWRLLDEKVKQYLVCPEEKEEKRYTLEDCYKLWIETKYSLANNTIQNYKLAFNNIGYLKYKYMNEFIPMNIQSLYAELYKTKQPWTVESVHIVLKQVFKFACDNKIISNNIMTSIDTPKKVRGKRRALTQEEKNAINKARDLFNPWEETFIMVCMYTGMRRNEILALKKKDIDFTKGIIQVNKMVDCDMDYKPIIKNSLKTEAGLRNIPIITKLSPVLKEYIETHCEDDESLLFATRSGGLCSSGAFSYRWKSIKKKINTFMPDNNKIDISPHYLRHNFATELFYAGIDLKTAQYIMGHESLSITLNIYTDLRMDNATVVKQLDNII